MNNESRTGFSSLQLNASQTRAKGGVFMVSASVSLLDSRLTKSFPVSLWGFLARLRAAASLLLLCAGLCGRAHAFTTVTVSTAAPKGLETAFLGATTSQFLSALIVNPLFPNTYQLKLFDFNPAYNPPPSPQAVFNAAVAISTQTYIYGWAAGVGYQQVYQEGFVSGMGNLCGSATNYTLTRTTTGTFSPDTCRDVAATFLGDLFQQSLSTVPVLGF